MRKSDFPSLKLVNGNWGEWQEWSDCSETCGDFGKKERSRKCDNPAAQNNGAPCDGNATELITCVGLPECPRKYVIHHFKEMYTETLK